MLWIFAINKEELRGKESGCFFVFFRRALFGVFGKNGTKESLTVGIGMFGSSLIQFWVSGDMVNAEKRVQGMLPY